MSEAPQQAIVDTMAYLREVHRDGVVPREAEARLRLLQARHPDTSMQLVWEREALDDSFHYDVLVRTPDRCTVSLSVCEDRTLPWPLRGVHRWSEADLVRVNGTVLTVQQAVACLDFMSGEARTANRLLDVCLIEEELAQRPIELSDEDLQTGLDAFRRANRLYDAEQTHAWMRTRGLTHAQLERLVADNLIVARLRDRIAGTRVESYFAEYQRDFDIAQIARIDCLDEAGASAIRRAIETEQIGFYEAAERELLADRSGGVPLFASLRRRDATDAIGDAVFAATPGEIIGPIHSGDRYVLVRVLARTPGHLDDSTRRLIEQQIFDDWLAERRHAATIVWYWGSVRDATAR